MKSTLMRRLSILLVLAMVLAMLPVGAMAADTPTTVYFENNWQWSDVRVHYWGAEESAWPGVAMTDTGKMNGDGTNKIYSAEIPAGCTGILFTGQKDNGSGLDQSPDITDFSSDVIYYMNWIDGNVVESYANDIFGGEEDGEVTEPVVTEPVEVGTITVYVDAAALGYTTVPNAYYWGGTSTSTWPGKAMTLVSGNIYSIEISADTPNIIFNNGSKQTADLKVVGDNTIWNGTAFVDYDTYVGAGDVEVFDYYVAGTFNGWDECSPNYGMTAANGIYSITFAVTAGAHTFKITNGTWTGAIGLDGSTAADAQNIPFEAAVDGDVTVTLDPTTNAYTITGSCLGDAPAIVVNAANVKGNFGELHFEEASTAGAMTLVDGIYTLTIPAVPASAVGAEAYKFKVMVNNSWNTAYPESDWTFYLSSTCDVTITYNPEGNVVDIKADGLTYDAPVDPDIPVVEDVYNVKGDVAGLDWDLTTGTGLMTKNDDGSYSLTIADVAAAGKYSIKVVKNASWDGAIGGQGAGGNYEFSVSATDTITITVSAEGALSVTGAYVGEPVATELVIDSVVIAGGGDLVPNTGFLYGIEWNPSSMLNGMFPSEEAPKVYSVTYANVAAGEYQFKFAINGSWDISYASGDAVVSGETVTAWHSPLGNSSFVVTEDGSTVTFVLDLTNVVYATDDAEMTVTIEAPVTVGESSAPETLVIGENNFVIATGDKNVVAGSFTATTTGTLSIIPTAMTVINWMGEAEEVPAEYINMQFGRAYGIMVNGETVYGNAIEVVAGETYEIGVIDFMGAGAPNVTLTLCDNHNMAYSFANGYHTVGCSACGMGTSVEGTREFTIKNIGVTLGSDINISYKNYVDDCFTGVYMLFTVTDADGNVYESYGFDYEVDSSDRWVFLYGVNPQLMGDNVVATLYGNLNGYQVEITKTQSVLGYCKAILGMANMNAATKTLVSDLLVYGAKAQILKGYQTDNLVTTGVEGLCPSTFPGVDSLTANFAMANTELKNDNHDVKSYGMELSNKVSLKFGLALDNPELYTIQVNVNGVIETYGAEDLVVDTSKANRYFLYFDILATELDTPVTIMVLQDGVQVSRAMTYSAADYIKASAGKGDALADLLQALYNYGKSAEALG